MILMISEVLDLLANLIKSYLEQRQVKIVLFHSCSGIPQGSNLGLLLFWLFINDISQSNFSYVLFYYKDLKIYIVVNNKSNAMDVRNDLSNVGTLTSAIFILVSLN